MKVLDLFSGIGGMSLGLERAGFVTVAFCECEPFRRRILARHWPHVPIFDDIRDLTAANLAAAGIATVDVIAGGFPCQDMSIAGSKRGLAGSRSGLWSECARLVGELRPKYLLVENVTGLLVWGMGEILGQLAAIGYDADWHCISASAIGAPHRRDRVWIVAYPGGDQLRHEPRWWVRSCRSDPSFLGNDGEAELMADADVAGRAQQWRGVPIHEALALAQCDDWWRTEPVVGRVADGIPDRVDRLEALGNAVVPQIVELIGRAILQHHSQSH